MKQLGPTFTRRIKVFDTMVEGFILTPARHFYGRIMFLFLFIYLFRKL